MARKFLKKNVLSHLENENPLRVYQTLISITKIEQGQEVLMRKWGRGPLIHSWWESELIRGHQNGCSQNMGSRTTVRPSCTTVGYMPQISVPLRHRDIRVLTVLFTIARKWASIDVRQQINKWIHNEVHIHSAILCNHKEENEMMIARKPIEVETVILSGKTARLRVTSSLICGF